MPGGLHPPSHPAALIQWLGVQACASQLPRLESGQVQGAIGAAQNHEGQAAPGTWPGLLNLWLISAPLVASSRARPSEIGCPPSSPGGAFGEPSFKTARCMSRKDFPFFPLRAGPPRPQITARAMKSGSPGGEFQLFTRSSPWAGDPLSLSLSFLSYKCETDTVPPLMVAVKIK